MKSWAIKLLLFTTTFSKIGKKERLLTYSLKVFNRYSTGIILTGGLKTTRKMKIYMRSVPVKQPMDTLNLTVHF